MILWSPYLSDLNTANQVFRRIFPLNRGIYEDKVANFWYCLSVFIKIKNYFEEYQLAWIRFVCIKKNFVSKILILFFLSVHF